MATMPVMLAAATENNPLMIKSLIRRHHAFYSYKFI